MESSSAARQSLQRIVVRHAERGEVTVVRRENRQATGGGRGGDRDVLEAGIVCAIENGAGVAGFLDAEGQDTPGIEMLDGREPAAQALRLGSGADPLAAGDARLDLIDCSTAPRASLLERWPRSASAFFALSSGRHIVRWPPVIDAENRS
jgi:hypothetical protein